MPMGRCSRSEWHYNTTYGLVGMLAAATVLIVMRHDMAQALSFAVAITSAAGWTRRRVPPPEAAGGQA